MPMFDPSSSTAQALLFRLPPQYYTMRQKFSIFFNPHFFMIKYANVFDMRFIGRVLHYFTFHDNLRAFLTSTVCHATLKKSCKSRGLQSTCTPCQQNSHWLIRTCSQTCKPEINLKIFNLGRRPNSTLCKRKIVIGMLTANMMNKQIVRHFQACEFTIFSLRTKIRQMGSVKKKNQTDRSRKTTSREDIDKVTSFRHNRFLSIARIPGLVKKWHGNQDLCQNSYKTTEGCGSALTSPIRLCSVNCLHKRGRLNWTKTGNK